MEATDNNKEVMQPPVFETKLCPFCGGEPELYTEDENYWEPSAVYCYCTACLARGSYAFNKEEAIAYWNTRVIRKVKDENSL